MLKWCLAALKKTCSTGFGNQSKCNICHVPMHQLARSLGNAVDAKDSTTFNHSEDVARASELLAKLLGLPDKDVETIHLAAHLHDIGKIGIPDSILRKPGRLDKEEFEQIKLHPEIGARIVEPILSFGAPSGVTDIILHHHERYDGLGYPDGLKGAKIPLGARIIAVADTLSAMLQNRHYRNGTTFEKAVAEIIRCSGSQFDPAVGAVMYDNQDLLEGIFSINDNSAETTYRPITGNLNTGFFLQNY
jgi:putative nucleotidyltransferase with HDIG domain